MPNHVASYLEFKGSTEEVDTILLTVKGQDDDKKQKLFSCNSIIPMPDHIYRGSLGQEEKEKYGKDNWYDWSCDNWGSKWDVYDLSGVISRQNNAVKFITNTDVSLVRISFSTAWSTINNVICKLSEMFPKTKFKYVYLDEGMGFGGSTIFLGGMSIKQSESMTSAERSLNTSPKLKGGEFTKL